MPSNGTLQAESQSQKSNIKKQAFPWNLQAQLILLAILKIKTFLSLTYCLSLFASVAKLRV